MHLIEQVTQLEWIFSVFGMFMIIMGFGGAHRIKFWKIEIGPLKGSWRVLSIVLGIIILFGVGAMFYFKELAQINHLATPGHPHP